MKAKYLDIQVMADRAAISERKSETRFEENGNARLWVAVSFRTEFRYDKFPRDIPLPAHV